MKPIVISLIQAKGGVAKTTSAVSIATALALKDYRVALLDFDHQNHCSLFFNNLTQNNLNSSLDFFHSKKSLQECLHKTNIQQLYIMPSSMELSFREYNTDIFTAKEKINNQKHNFNFIIIDNNPSMNVYVKNAILASDYILIPITPSPLSSEGFQTLIRELNVFISQHNIKVNILGIFFTIVETNLAVSKYLTREIQKEYKSLMLNTFIRKDVKIVESPALSTDIFTYKKYSRAATDYLNLTNEIINKLNENKGDEIK